MWPPAWEADEIRCLDLPIVTGFGVYDFRTQHPTFLFTAATFARGIFACSVYDGDGPKPLDDGCGAASAGRRTPCSMRRNHSARACTFGSSPGQYSSLPYTLNGRRRDHAGPCLLAP